MSMPLMRGFVLIVPPAVLPWSAAAADVSNSTFRHAFIAGRGSFWLPVKDSRSDALTAAPMRALL